VVAGVVMLPAHGRTYAAAEAGGATRDGAPIAPTARTGLDGASVLAGGGQFSDAQWRGRAPKVERHFRPSLAYRMCLAAEGRFDAMLTFRDAWEWDVAAGDLIAREAGAAATTRQGAPAFFNNSCAQVEGMIVAGPALHAEILARRGDGR
jgi:myo-inositol-1(or 4)-monophosphatase